MTVTTTTTTETMTERALRPFQNSAANFVAQKLRAMLLMDMGLGKTPTSAKVASMAECRRILVVCPDNAMTVWAGKRGELAKDDFAGKDWIELFTGRRVFVHRMENEPWNRELEWNTPTDASEVHLYIVVFNTFANDMGVPQKVKKAARLKGKVQRVLERSLKPKQGFDAVIVDECRRIRNRDSAGYRALRLLFNEYVIPIFIPMTGTLISKGPQDTWTVFNLIDKKRFSSYWTFVEHFCNLIDNPWGGKEIVGLKEDRIQEWHRLLSSYAYVVSEDDPEIQNQRPPITRQRLVVKMDTDQAKQFKELKKEMMIYLEQDDTLIVAQNSFVKLLRLRQLLVCPKLLAPSLSIGGAMTDFVKMIKEGDLQLPSVIFTPFVAAFEPMKAYLREKELPHVFTLSGGIHADERDRRIDAWRRAHGVMLCSILYAQAFSLEPATKAFFIGAEWDPNDNRQAEKRLHRLTTLNPINIWYYTYESDEDERLFDVLNFRQDAIDISLPKNLRQLFNM